MRHLGMRLAALASAAGLVLAFTPSVSADTVWFSGQRMFAGFSVEPAVNMGDGSEIFLLTPNKAPTNANMAHAHAPLYLVLYPGVSTIPASTLNCQPTNCDHANAFPPYNSVGGLKGHDHLVGVNPTGDYNIAWDVYPIVFTPKGFGDGAINNRILTWTQLSGELASHDVVQGSLIVSFNCAKTSISTYMLGTEFSTN